MAQPHVAHPPQVRRPLSGAVGLVLILAYPLANMIVGMGVVLVPAPRVLSVLGGVVLLAGGALVIHAGLPQPARRWVQIATALAGVTVLAALLPQSELGLSPLRIVLAGGSLATLSWGMRCWMRAIAHSRGVVWWTAKTVLEVVAVASMSLVGPLNADPTGGADVALLVGVLAALVALTRLGVHVGAIVTGLQAFTRADAAGDRGATPAPSTVIGPPDMPGSAVSASATSASVSGSAVSASAAVPGSGSGAAAAPAAAGEPARPSAPAAVGEPARPSAPAPTPASAPVGSTPYPFANRPAGGPDAAPWPARRGAAPPAGGGPARPTPAGPPNRHAGRSSRLRRIWGQLAGRHTPGEVTWSPPSSRIHQP